jgi:hypothetical protein
MSTTARQGYSPNRAGENLLAFCQRARSVLRSQLVKPPRDNELAYEAYVESILAIHRMDHRELTAAMQALSKGSRA